MLCSDIIPGCIWEDIPEDDNYNDASDCNDSYGNDK